MSCNRVHTGVVLIQAGCYDCGDQYGYDARWQAANAMAVAKRHHNATGHHTWVEQAIVVHYGKRDG